MTTPDILEILAKRVETASSLDELYRARASRPHRRGEPIDKLVTAFDEWLASL